MENKKNDSKPKIIIVEDEKDLLTLIANKLSKDFEVDTATNGEAALEMIEKNEYDMVLTDIKMPKLNGIDLIKTMKDKGILEKTPAVVLSGYIEKGISEKAMEAGAYGIMAKPFDFRLLVEKINEALTSKHLKGALSFWDSGF